MSSQHTLWGKPPPGPRARKSGTGDDGVAAPSPPRPIAGASPAFLANAVSARIWSCGRVAVSKIETEALLTVYCVLDLLLL